MGGGAKGQPTPTKRKTTGRLATARRGTSLAGTFAERQKARKAGYRAQAAEIRASNRAIKKAARGGGTRWRPTPLNRPLQVAVGTRVRARIRGERVEGVVTAVRINPRSLALTSVTIRLNNPSLRRGGRLRRIDLTQIGNSIDATR